MERSDKKIRSIDVAARAQISRSTVSRVFSGDPRISEQTRALVMQAAAELGYQPNLIARSLKSNRTRIIGVVVTEITGAYHAHALQVLIEKLGAARLAPLVFVGRTPEGAANAIERLMSYQVDAVIALAAPFVAQIVGICTGRNIPIVLMNSYDGPENVAAISSDNLSAGRMVAEHFLARGARRLAFFGGGDGTGISGTREAGYRDHLESIAGVRVECLYSGYDYASAREAAWELVALAPDAVFCANDTLAFALSDALRDSGRRDWPMIAGYDNSAMAEWSNYDLTSVDHDLGRIAALAVEAALALADDPSLPAPRHLVAPRLIARGSTLNRKPKE